MSLNLHPGPRTVKKTPLRGNPKYKIPNPKPTQSSQIQNSGRSSAGVHKRARLENLNFEFVWNLEFGIWDFSRSAGCDLEFEICLGFVIWNLEFPLRGQTARPQRVLSSRRRPSPDRAPFPATPEFPSSSMCPARAGPLLQESNRRPLRDGGR